MKIQNVADDAFRRYGKVLEGYDFTELLKEMKHTPVPEDVIYVPSVEEMEALPVAKELQNKGYGGLPIEIGYCNGHNKKLNGLEYHRNSEINVAVTDLVLLIGHQQDIEKDFTYDTSKVEAFLVPAGTAIEVYATTLHYAPCHVNESGFQCVVVLPKGLPIRIRMWRTALGLSPDIKRINCVSRCGEIRYLLLGILGTDTVYSRQWATPKKTLLG